MTQSSAFMRQHLQERQFRYVSNVSKDFFKLGSRSLNRRIKICKEMQENPSENGIKYVKGYLLEGARNYYEDIQIEKYIRANFILNHLGTIYISRFKGSQLDVIIYTDRSSLLVKDKAVEKFRAYLNRLCKKRYKSFNVSVKNLDTPNNNIDLLVNRLIFAIEEGQDYGIRPIIDHIRSLPQTDPNVKGIWIRLKGRIRKGTMASTRKISSGTLNNQTIHANIYQVCRFALAKGGKVGITLRINYAGSLKKDRGSKVRNLQNKNLMTNVSKIKNSQKKNLRSKI